MSEPEAVKHSPLPPALAQAHHVAITHHCRLACETAHPRFRHLIGPKSSGFVVALTVNSGYE